MTTTITLQQFKEQTPVLYGFVNFSNGGQKTGTYKLAFNKYTNKMQYQLFYESGRIADRKFGIGIDTAYRLMNLGQLNFDPERGRKENYM
ncbi:MAG: hypothetical protein FWF53_01270 [Candidatus Azobacteroides sp.]|nr:hypothetical protein [Candidatus Azobacteroides sp.]